MFKGDRLKSLRISKGLSQQNVADILEVTKSSVCCYEKGTRTPTIEGLITLVTFFNVSSDYLVGNDVLVDINNEKTKVVSMTEEEVRFIKLLREDKYLSEILLEDANRSLELLKKKIG